MNRKTLYYIKQKLIGILLIVLSVISAIVTGDGTASLFLVPVGIYVTLTKEMIIADDYLNDQSNN